MIKIKKILGKEKKYLLDDGRIVNISDVKAGRIKDIVPEIKKVETKISKKKVKKKTKKNWFNQNEH